MSHAGVHAIGLGASPAGPVLARPLFDNLMIIHRNCMQALRAPITAGPL